jgi:hypothetical protein
MHSRLVQRYALTSLILLFLLVGIASVFVYQVSPLRDPSFQPNSANAGSLLPWLQGVSEGVWLQGANVLAALLATNITVVVYQHSQFFTLPAIRQQGFPHGMSQFTTIVIWGVFWVVIFGGFWMAFLGYLLGQWLVD